MKDRPLPRFIPLAATLALAAAQAGCAGHPPAGPPGAFDVLDFGAVPDGTTDCTAAFQRAIDAAAAPGGVVRVPAGKFLFRGSLVLKMGVCMAGLNGAPRSWEPATGSILLPTAGRDREDAPAFIEMRSSTSIRGVTIYYPEQNVDDIRPYPWTIHMRADPAEPRQVCFDCTVEDVTVINGYNGIRTGPTENGRHRIRSVHGCFLRRGILVDWTGDIGRIEDVQIHSHFWAHPAFAGNWDRAFAYMQANLEAFVFGRTDWEYVANTFVFPARVGYRFIETANGAANGQFCGIGADATGACVVVESIQPQGLLITNGEFNSHRVGPSTQVIVEPSASGNVRFVNCGFWGPVSHNAVLRGSSFISFSDCYFSNDDPEGGASIVAEGGKLQAENCTFGAVSRRRRPGNAWAEDGVRRQPTGIHLKPGLRGAIVRGNNGYYGVEVVNEIGDKAIISENEPFRPEGR